MATFRGVTFGERGQGGQTFPRHKRKAVSSIVHTLDGSNRVQYSGKTADSITLVAKCTESALNSLYGYVATSGTLDYSGGTRTAFLDEVDPQEITGGHDTFFVNLTFILS